MQFNVSVKIPNPSTYSRDTRHGDVFGTVVSGHRLAAALVCGIRRTRTTQILFRCLHDTFGVLNSLVHAVPIIARTGGSFSGSGCHGNKQQVFEKFYMILNDIKFLFHSLIKSPLRTGSTTPLYPSLDCSRHTVSCTAEPRALQYSSIDE